MSQRLTKSELQFHFGSLNPLGHTVLAFDDDAAARDAADVLRKRGFKSEDLLFYSAAEVRRQLPELVDLSQRAVGLGREITLMRRYLELVRSGAGWLVVYTGDEDRVERLTELCERIGARSSVRYEREAAMDLM